MRTAKKGRTHDRTRPRRRHIQNALASKGPFSNRISFVNSLLLATVVAVVEAEFAGKFAISSEVGVTFA
jgi:hypothetical protein